MITILTSIRPSLVKPRESIHRPEVHRSLKGNQILQNSKLVIILCIFSTFSSLLASPQALLSGAVVLAIENNDVKLLNSCIENGFDINQAIDSRVGLSEIANFALHHAALYDRPDCVAFLLSKGALIETRDGIDKVAFEYAEDEKVSKLLEKRAFTNPSKEGAIQELATVLAQDVPRSRIYIDDLTSFGKRVIRLDSFLKGRFSKIKNFPEKHDNNSAIIIIAIKPNSPESIHSYHFEFRRNDGDLANKFISGTVKYKGGWWLVDSEVISEN